MLSCQSRAWPLICFVSLTSYAGLIFYLSTLFVYYRDAESISSPNKSKLVSTCLGIILGASSGISLLKITQLTLAIINHSRTLGVHAIIATIMLISSCSIICQWLHARSIFMAAYLTSSASPTIVLISDYLVTLPLFFLVNIALDGRNYVRLIDCWISFSPAIFLSAQVMSWFQAHSNVNQMMLFIVSHLIILAALQSNYADSVASSHRADMKLANTPERILQQKLCAKRCNNSIYLAFAYLLFIALSLLHAYQIVENELSYILNLTASLLYKLLFSILVLEDHSESLDRNSYNLILERIAKKARKNFLRYVFHEVRVPLNSISMGLHILNDELSNASGIDRENGDVVDIMRSATSSMSETLNDVLTLQKIEEGKFQLSYESFKISSLLNSLRKNIHDILSRKDLQLSISVDDEVPAAVIGDRYRIEHVLLNLLSNAIKFSPPHTTIRIQVNKCNVSNGLIRFSVADYGIGMIDKEKRSILLSEISNHSSEHSNGYQNSDHTGIGLNLCREIVKLHGGEIGFETRPRQGSDIYSGGTEFYVNLPLETSSGTDLISAEAESSLDDYANGRRLIKEISALQEIGSDEDNTPVHKPLHILIVDGKPTRLALLDNLLMDVFVDVTSNRKILKALLMRQEVEVDMVENGKDCIDQVNLKPLDHYDIIFMDNFMPIMVRNPLLIYQT
jgi:signal transduction histidine kinase